MRNGLIAAGALALLSLPFWPRMRSQRPPEEEAERNHIVPLDVRDPSALVMDPGKEWTGPSIERPSADSQNPASTASPRFRWPSLPWVARSRFESGDLENRFRAFTLPINDYELGLIRPGDRIDVLAAFTAHANASSQQFSATVLQNVKVLDVQRAADSAGKGALTLELNPNETEYAALVAHQADLSVALRRAGDDEIYPMEMADFARLFR